MRIYKSAKIIFLDLLLHHNTGIRKLDRTLLYVNICFTSLFVA